jgi:hypothetical protein
MPAATSVSVLPNVGPGRIADFWASETGALSGAGLLRFLQRCATDVDLASRATLKSVASPSSTMSSSAQIAPEQLASYIEAYFGVFHLQYPLVHQATFRVSTRFYAF